MTYKKILLIVLLMPGIVLATASEWKRIHQLKEDLNAKEVELSDIRVLIEEKEAQIDSMSLQLREFYAGMCELLSDQERQSFEKDISDFHGRLSRSHWCKKDFKQLIMQKALTRAH